MLRNSVFPRIGGIIRKKPSSATMPGASRKRMFSGRGRPSQLIQKYSDKFTFTAGSSLWMSQYSNGPKKDQFGPRRNVPMITSDTHRSRKPTQKNDTAKGRS